MAMKVTSHRVEDPKVAMQPPIGSKWGVTGVTRIARSLDKSEIVVSHTPEAKDEHRTTLAEYHEHGHVCVAVDLISVYGRKDTPDMIMRYDKWQGEVEAWVRGFEKHGVTNITEEEMHFVLDCLNTYRRGLHVPDSEWSDMIEIMQRFCDQDIKDYEPTEPEPGEGEGDGDMDVDVEWVDADEIQDGDEILDGEDEIEGGESGESGEEEGDDQKGEDGDDQEGEGDEDKGNGPVRGQGEEPKDPGQLRTTWLSKEVIDRVTNGESIESVAKDLGVEPNSAPPLITAIVKARP